MEMGCCELVVRTCRAVVLGHDVAHALVQCICRPRHRFRECVLNSHVVFR